MKNMAKEEGLDPADWTELKELAHRMVDDMFGYLQTVSERPAWVKPDEQAISQMHLPVPRSPQPANAVYEDFLKIILPFNSNNVHPRFWAWVQGGGTATGMLADLLASGMNANVSIGNHMPMYVEKQVLDWSKEMLGFPAGASGILTSGGSLANITAIQVARNHFNKQIKQKGLHAVTGQLKVYGSAETHQCVIKAVECAGIGAENFCKISVDSDYKILTGELEIQLARDKQAGFVPFCIIGNAGTVNTGATDNLLVLASIAKKHGIWFHVDGAFGAIPQLLPECRESLKGLDQADSISFDFHKWLYMNYEVGCLLIKDPVAHREAFASDVNYLLRHERGLSSGPDSFSNYGLELSRGFKALKVWMLLKENGLDKYARMVKQNLDQAQYLASGILATKDAELMAPVPLNIVCYRYNPGNLNEQALNDLNKEILMRLHEQGIASASYTILKGRYTIRVAICNHRSRREDFDILLKESMRIGRELNV